MHRALLIAGMLLFGLLALSEPVRILADLSNAGDATARLLQLGLIRSPY